MRKLIFASLLLLALPLHAQFARRHWGVRGGLADGEVVIGGEYLMTIAAHVLFTPNVEVSTDFVSANADVAYGFELTPQAAAWGGLGAALIHPDESDLDAGLNVFAGIGVARGAFYPYVQVKHTSPSDGDGGYTTAVFGVRF